MANNDKQYRHLHGIGWADLQWNAHEPCAGSAVTSPSARYPRKLADTIYTAFAKHMERRNRVQPRALSARKSARKASIDTSSDSEGPPPLVDDSSSEQGGRAEADSDTDSDSSEEWFQELCQRYAKPSAHHTRLTLADKARSRDKPTGRAKNAAAPAPSRLSRRDSERIMMSRREPRSSDSSVNSPDESLTTEC